MSAPQQQQQQQSQERASALPTLDERLNTARADLSSLGRVSHRLALVDSTDRLQQVLDKLLPRLLKRVGDNHAAKVAAASSSSSSQSSTLHGQLLQVLDHIHAKLVEMLSHTIKRVRDDPACRIPCPAVLNLLVEEPLHDNSHHVNNKNNNNSDEVEKKEPSTPPQGKLPETDTFTLNLSLAFLTLGLPRALPVELEEMLPALLVLVGQSSGLDYSAGAPAKRSQAHQIAHLLLRAFERLVVEDNKIAKFQTKPLSKSGLVPSAATVAAGTTSHPPPSSTTKKSQVSSHLSRARTACHRSPYVGAAVYDLLLDCVLYQPTRGGIPPAGLSQSGQERLHAGHSSTARDWAAEMAPPARLAQLKVALLDFVAPSKRWGLFLSFEGDSESETGSSRHRGWSGEGLSRTVALLVAASGDPAAEVSDRASTILKMHLDSFWGVETGSKAVPATGDPLRLSCEMLSLALGQNLAESALASASASAARAGRGNGIPTAAAAPAAATTLGRFERISSDDAPSRRQLVLSTRRRAVSDSTLWALLQFVSSKVLEDHPQILDVDDVNEVDAYSSCTSAGWRIRAVGTLAVDVAGRTLSRLGSSSGLSALRARPYVAAARLLNALSVRLAVYHDAHSEDHDEHHRQQQQKEQLSSSGIAHLMSRAMSLACDVLAPVSGKGRSTTAATASASQGNIAVRDACYGVVCTLSRSRWALSPSGCVFTRGGGEAATAAATTTERSPAPAKATASIETTTLLFGCAANEEETLRPRAVAALDAILGAYCRLYDDKDNESQQMPTSLPAAVAAATTGSTVAANPWSTAKDAAVPAAELSAATNASIDDGPSGTSDRAALCRSLLPLIWTAAQGYQPKASRVAAARWSGELLKRLELASACHILCFLSGDADATCSSIAREGLGLSGIGTTDGPPETAEDAAAVTATLPDFGDFTEMLFRSEPGTTSSSLRVQTYWDFSFRGKAVALRFGLRCLLNDLYGGEDRVVGVYFSVLAETLRLFFGRGGSGGTGGGTARGRESLDLLDWACFCLLSTLSVSRYARTSVTACAVPSGGTTAIGLSIEEMEALLLECHSSRARRHLAGACGKLYEDADLWKASERLDVQMSFASWISHSKVDQSLAACAENLVAVAEGNRHAVPWQVHGAAFLGAHVVRALRAQSVALSGDPGGDHNHDHDLLWSQVSSVLVSLGRGTLHVDEVIGNACADGLAIALSYNGADAPVLDTRLYGGCASVLTRVSAALARYGHGDLVDPPRASKLARAAGVCLAATTTGAGVVVGSNDDADASSGVAHLGPSRLACAESLFDLLGSTSFRKDEEIAAVAGEALALYADAYSPREAVWSSPAPMMGEWPSSYDGVFARELPPHQHTLYVLLRRVAAENSPHKRTACAPALLAVVARAARGVNSDDAYASRSLVKSLLKKLIEIQQVFIRLLSDPKSRQLSRESCCLGLAACRGLSKARRSVNGRSPSDGSASEELNGRLLRAFGQTANFGGSLLMETSAQAAERRAAQERERTDRSASGPGLMEAFGVESEVGGTSGMSEAALGAYREMASASLSLGRVDVLYALLMLSVSHPYWSTPGAMDRYSALSLLGESSFIGSRANSSAMREALRPHLGKLLPRILRACHDPNKQTREQMSALWVGLTGGGAESRLAITHHFLTALDALVEDASSKLWRARVGACGALAEIIVGREWSSFGGGGAVLSDDDLYTAPVGSSSSSGVRLLRLWRAAMRALDDVRGSVRDSGETLARAVRALTIRLCDPAMAEKPSGAKRGREDLVRREKEASAAAATSLRWIIRHGLNQPCPEAIGVCVSTLVEVVGVVSPRILGPILPDLLRSLLMAISGLEPAALNYLQLRMEDQEGLERVRLQLAQSGPLATAVTKCLDLLPNTGIEIQRAVVTQLDSALRLSAGFATRAATADATSVLCNTCPDAFRFPASSSANPSIRLLRAFYFASERERGQGAKDKMIHALGNLAALCPGPAVRSLALRACERYNSSTGNNDDPATRRAAAAALRAIAVRASKQFTDGGVSDLWCRRVLPVAFIGQKDSDTKIAGLWKEVWGEGGGATNTVVASGTSSFGTTLEETLLPYLVKECVRALKDVSWARRVAGSNALADLCDLGILSPPPLGAQAACNGSISASVMLRARRRAQGSNVALEESIRLLARPRLWTGKSQVLNATVKLASKWTSVEACEDSDERVLYGWDGEQKFCPWKPLVDAPGEYEDDLFVGDNWFSTAPAEDVGIADPEDATDDEAKLKGKGNEEKINFDECDAMLGNEDPISDVEGNVDEVSSVVTFAGLSRFLIDQALPSLGKQTFSASDEFLPYRAAAFRGFRDMLNSLPATCHSQKSDIYQRVSHKLIAVVNHIPSSERQREPPVLVAGAVNCLSSCFWEGMGTNNSGIDHANATDFVAMFQEAGGNQQPAWTVREASALATAQLAAVCHIDSFRQLSVVSTMVESAAHALKDRKFWRVRYAGLSVLRNLVARAGSGVEKSAVREQQLILEALLPFKEEILKLVRSSLADPEAKVTALSGDVLGSMAWWP